MKKEIIKYSIKYFEQYCSYSIIYGKYSKEDYININFIRYYIYKILNFCIGILSNYCEKINSIYPIIIKKYILKEKIIDNNLILIKMYNLSSLTKELWIFFKIFLKIKKKEIFV